MHTHPLIAGAEEKRNGELTPLRNGSQKRRRRRSNANRLAVSSTSSEYKSKRFIRHVRLQVLREILFLIQIGITRRTDGTRTVKVYRKQLQFTQYVGRPYASGPGGRYPFDRFTAENVGRPVLFSRGNKVARGEKTKPTDDAGEFDWEPSPLASAHHPVVGYGQGARRSLRPTEKIAGADVGENLPGEDIFITST